MKPDIRGARVANQDVPIFEWGPPSGPAIVFLHGFGREPDHYAFLSRLAAEQGFRVVAPLLYPNNRLPEPPRSFRACVALTRAVLRQLADEGRLADGYTLIGHSTGGAVAKCLANLHPTPGAILALNPVMPVAYGPWGFAVRAIRIAWRQLLGRTGPAWRGWALQLRHGVSQLGNLLRKPELSRALTRDLSTLQLQEFRLLYDASGSRGVRFGLPCAVFQAQEDEFFRVPPDLRAWMGLAFDHFELRELRDVRGHEWPLMHPELAARSHRLGRRSRPHAGRQRPRAADRLGPSLRPRSSGTLTTTRPWRPPCPEPSSSARCSIPRPRPGAICSGTRARARPC